MTEATLSACEKAQPSMGIVYFSEPFPFFAADPQNFIALLYRVKLTFTGTTFSLTIILHHYTYYFHSKPKQNLDVEHTRWHFQRLIETSFGACTWDTALDSM